MVTRHRAAGRPGEAGYITAFSLLVLVLLSSSVALLALALQLRMRTVREDKVDVRLVALNDAVVAETLAELGEGVGFPGVREKDFGQGQVASDVERLGPRKVAIHARASYAGRTRLTRTEVALTVQGPVVVEWRRVPAVGE